MNFERLKGPLGSFLVGLSTADKVGIKRLNVLMRKSA